MDLFNNNLEGNIIKISCIPTEMFLIEHSPDFLNCAFHCL